MQGYFKKFMMKLYTHTYIYINTYRAKHIFDSVFNFSGLLLKILYVKIKIKELFNNLSVTSENNVY